MSGYQTQVYNQPAIGVAGDFADANARMTLVAGPGGLVAGPNGVTVGRFAWTAPPTDPNGSNQVANSSGSGNVAGFVYNDLQALNTVFLSDATMVIPEGLPVSLAVQGDFIVVNDGATEAQVGMKAYADFATGKVSFAAAGAPATGATSTGSSIAAETNSFTGSIAGDVLTVSDVASGTIYPGTTISGTGIASGTKIAAQLSGTPGGVGTYLLSVSQQQNLASQSISGTYGLMTIGTLTSSASFAVGQTLVASGAVVAGTHITANVSGTGGSSGTMVVDNNTVVSSQAIDSVGNVETKWYAASAGIAGQLVKITSWVGAQG
jgi:hypothetical protein